MLAYHAAPMLSKNLTKSSKNTDVISKRSTLDGEGDFSVRYVTESKCVPSVLTTIVVYLSLCLPPPPPPTPSPPPPATGNTRR